MKVNKDKFIILLLFICAFLLRIVFIGRDLEGVELETWVEYISRPFLQIIWDYTLPNNHILNSLLARLFYLTLGKEEWVLRMPSLVFGMGAFFIFIKFSCLLFKNPFSRYGAMIFFALSPSTIYFSQTCRGYSPLIFFSLLSYYSVYKIIFLGRSKAINWTILCLGVTLSVLSVLSGIYFFISLFFFCYLALLFQKKNVSALPSYNKYLKNLIIVTVISLCIVAFVYFPAMDGVKAHAIRFGATFNFQSLFYSIFLNNYFVQGYSNILFLFFALGFLFLAIQNRFLLYYFASPFIITFALGAFSKTLGPARVYIFLYPFFILIILYGVDRLLLLIKSQKVNVAALYFFYLFIIVFPVKHLVYHYYPLRNVYDLSSFHQYIADNLGEYDVLLFAKPMNSQILFYGIDTINREMNRVYEQGKLNRIFIVTSKATPGQPVTIDNFPLSSSLGQSTTEPFHFSDVPLQVIKNFGPLALYKLQTKQVEVLFPPKGKSESDFESNLKWLSLGKKNMPIEMDVDFKTKTLGNSSIKNKMPYNINGYDAVSNYLIRWNFERDGLILFFYSHRVIFKEKELTIERKVISDVLKKAGHEHWYYELKRSHLLDKVSLLSLDTGTQLFSLFDFPGKGFFRTGNDIRGDRWNLNVHIGKIKGGKTHDFLINYKGRNLHEMYFDKFMVLFVNF